MTARIASEQKGNGFAVPKPFFEFDLAGRTALVTGGGTGLGFHIARALLRSGAAVMIAARRKAVLDDAEERLTREIPDARVHTGVVDLEDSESVQDLVRQAETSMDGVDIFVGNAAHTEQSAIELVADELIERTLRVNVGANIRLCRAVLPHMRRQRWGRVIFCSSVNSVCAPPDVGLSVYTASKGALNAFTRVAAAEAGLDGVTVNSLVLGVYLTQMSRDALAALDDTHGTGAGDAAYATYANMTALGRWGECAEIEPVVQLLASDAGSYITGSNLVIDGGLSTMLHPRAT